MAVHTQGLEPIAIPAPVEVPHGPSPYVRSPKSLRRAKRTSYTAVSQQSLQRLQQYHCHPLSDEYVPGVLYGDSDDDLDMPAAGDSFYSDDDSDESCSSFSSVSSTPFRSFDSRGSASVATTSTSLSTASVPSFSTTSGCASPPALCISPSSLTSDITRITSHHFNSGGPLMSRSPSTDALIGLLHTPAPRRTFVSNLSSSFRTWKDSVAGHWSESPRTTDDSLPPAPAPPSHPAPAPQELITFTASHASEPQDVVPTRRPYKSRDQRINPGFLRLYAADFYARTVSRTLPNTAGDPNTHDHAELAAMVDANPSLKHFHYCNNIYRISSMSRDKLWKSIILPPRDDDSPAHCIDHSSYIPTSDGPAPDATYSVIRPSGKNYMPWCSRPTPSATSTFTPAGAARNGPVLLNGLAPSSGVTKTQFTVKGWCNPRWVSE